MNNQKRTASVQTKAHQIIYIFVLSVPKTDDTNHETPPLTPTLTPIPISNRIPFPIAGVDSWLSQVVAARPVALSPSSLIVF